MNNYNFGVFSTVLSRLSMKNLLTSEINSVRLSGVILTEKLIGLFSGLLVNFISLISLKLYLLIVWATLYFYYSIAVLQGR